MIIPLETLLAALAELESETPDCCGCPAAEPTDSEPDEGDFLIGYLAGINALSGHLLSALSE